jgi:hypothetical protein
VRRRDGKGRNTKNLAGRDQGAGRKMTARLSSGIFGTYSRAFLRNGLDMHAEKTCDHNDNNDYADDVENIHDLGPIQKCATLQIALTLSSVKRR